MYLTIEILWETSPWLMAIGEDIPNAVHWPTYAARISPRKERTCIASIPLGLQNREGGGYECVHVLTNQGQAAARDNPLTSALRGGFEGGKDKR